MALRYGEMLSEAQIKGLLIEGLRLSLRQNFRNWCSTNVTAYYGAFYRYDPYFKSNSNCNGLVKTPDRERRVQKRRGGLSKMVVEDVSKHTTSKSVTAVLTEEE